MADTYETTRSKHPLEHSEMDTVLHGYHTADCQRVNISVWTTWAAAPQQQHFPLKMHAYHLA